MARRQTKTTELDRAKQAALQGRQIDILKIGPYCRAIDAAIAAGVPQAEAIAAAVAEFTIAA